jgi:hypothetical protein
MFFTIFKPPSRSIVRQMSPCSRLSRLSTPSNESLDESPSDKVEEAQVRAAKLQAAAEAMAEKLEKPQKAEVVIANCRE